MIVYVITEDGYCCGRGENIIYVANSSTEVTRFTRDWMDSHPKSGTALSIYQCKIGESTGPTDEWYGREWLKKFASLEGGTSALVGPGETRPGERG